MTSTQAWSVVTIPTKTEDRHARRDKPVATVARVEPIVSTSTASTPTLGVDTRTQGMCVRVFFLIFLVHKQRPLVIVLVVFAQNKKC